MKQNKIKEGQTFYRGTATDDIKGEGEAKPLNDWHGFYITDDEKVAKGYMASNKEKKISKGFDGYLWKVRFKEDVDSVSFDIEDFSSKKPEDQAKEIKKILLEKGLIKEGSEKKPLMTILSANNLIYSGIHSTSDEGKKEHEFIIPMQMSSTAEFKLFEKYKCGGEISEPKLTDTNKSDKWFDLKNHISPSTTVSSPQAENLKNSHTKSQSSVGLSG